METYNKNGLNVYQITVPTPFAVGPVNMSLIERDQTLTLFDAGVATDEAWQILNQTLKNLGFQLKDIHNIVLTHHHNDHAGLINHIVQEHDVPVYAHPRAIPRVKRDLNFMMSRVEFFKQLYRQMGCDAIGDAESELLRDAISANQHLTVTTEILPLEDSTQVPGLLEIEAIFTPGHAPDHYVFYDASRRFLIGGDLLLPDLLPNALVESDENGQRLASMVLYRKSLIRCLSLEVDIVFPGHGSSFRDHVKHIKHQLNEIELRAAKLKALLTAPKTPFEIAQAMYPQVIKKEFRLVMSRVIGLLDYLEASGEVKKEMRNQVWYYWK